MKLLIDEVHIWKLNIGQPDLQNFEFISMLSEMERIRARSFRFNKIRKYFIITHGVLRIILGFYLNIKPGQLKFHYGSYGKPYINEKFCKESIQFNLSHSHEFAIYAFVRGHRVGVDLEYITDIQDFEEITAQLFSKQENTIFKKIPKSQKLRTFFKCWTIKEAYSKAVGTGLTEPFIQRNLSFALKKSICKFKTKINAEDAFYWSITSFTPTPNYIASLAVESHNWHLQSFQFVVGRNFDQLN